MFSNYLILVLVFVLELYTAPSVGSNEDVDFMKRLGRELTRIPDTLHTEENGDDGSPPDQKNIKERNSKLKEFADFMKQIAEGHIPTTASSRTENWGKIMEYPNFEVPSHSEFMDNLPKRQINKALENNPFKDLANPADFTGAQCPYEYSTLSKKYWGTTYCAKGFHCCGCWQHKCCSAGQEFPDDDDEDKIFGICQDTFWAWTGGMLVVIYVVMTLVRWVKKCSPKSNKQSTNPASLTPDGLEDNKKKLFSFNCKKKEEKQELLENENVA